MSNNTLQPLYGKTLAELQTICAELDMPRFAAKQIAGWCAYWEDFLSSLPIRTTAE